MLGQSARTTQKLHLFFSLHVRELWFARTSSEHGYIARFADQRKSRVDNRYAKRCFEDLYSSSPRNDRFAFMASYL